jgi:hypothetical protein
MYWSYLTNTDKFSQPNILTFESNEDLDKLSKGYCELILDNFFSSFGSDYDAIFISEFGPVDNPMQNEFKFLIKFNDVDKAKKILGR